MGFYFRDVYEFLFARRYVTASLEGQEVVFAVTTVCLVLQTLIVVQKENLARTEKSCLQILKQLLLDFLAVLLTDIKPQEPKSREEIGVRNTAKRMFMIALAMFIILIFLREMSTADKFLRNWSQSCNSFIVFKP